MAGAYQIGEFVLESKLGEGGMGVVFRARQVALDRWVALKLLAKPATGGSTFYERFHREARSAAQLVHPNIIQIYTIGEHKGAPYYAMEYVEGEDLARVLKSTGKLTVDEAVEIVRAVAKALSLAGDAGFVHRDIKPANIMISTGGLIKVMDFGLAKATASDNTLTREGQIMGTPTYLSPEQGMSKDVDTRSDLYSLGCVMYECLTGDPPFQGDSLPSLIFKHLYEPVKPLRELNPDVPESFAEVCTKLLAKKPEDRYQNGLELLEALAVILTNPAMAELSLSKRVRQVKAEKKPVSAQPIAAAVAEPPAPEAERPAGVPKEIAGNPPQPSMDLTPSSDEEPAAKASERPAAPVHGARESKKHLVFESGAPRIGDGVSKDAPTVIRIPPPSPRGPLPAIGDDADETRSIPVDGLSGMAKPATARRKPSGEIVVPPPPTGSSTRMVPVPEAPPPRTHSGSLIRPPTVGLIKRSNVSSYFQRQPDGRWTYDIAQGHCKYAEGLAAERLPGADLQVGRLGDCLLCSNWNRRNGCAIAAAQYIESTSRAKGVDLLEEIAAVWCITGRFDKGIAVLEEQIRNNPDDPDAYRGLARIYERPDYSGKDRNRAVILYTRFVDLANKKGGYSTIELERAQSRIAQLQAGAPKENIKPGMFSGLMLHTFPCFYRNNGTVFFGLGGVNREHVVVARAGEVDPDTGVSASEMGNPLMRATTFIRRIKSEKAKAEEREQVKKELDRISKTSVDLLLRETGRCHMLPLSEIQALEYSKDEATDQRTLRLRTSGHAHELIFSAAADMDADKCALMLRRMTGK